MQQFIDSYDFTGKKAIVRVDFNVPLNQNFEITDDNRIIELDKLDNEAEERNKNREVDAELKQAQLEATKKDNRVKNAISIAGILVPIGVTIWGTLKAFEFERDGTVTTLIGKGFINKLIHK